VSERGCSPRRESRDVDAELVRRSQAGEWDAFEELVRRHQSRVFSLIRRLIRGREDVEDVAQQAFAKAYFALRQFDFRSAFGTWLYRIVVNESYDWLRKKRVRRLVYEADLSEDQLQQLAQYTEEERAEPSPARRVEASDLVARLLRRLSAEDRLLLVLKEVEGFSVDEVAQITRLNPNTVKVRLFRARERLAKLLDRMQRRKGGRGHEMQGIPRPS
jgi:RNA polymerase sigma-70 factor (ECF subfamily)